MEGGSDDAAPEVELVLVGQPLHLPGEVLAEVPQERGGEGDLDGLVASGLDDARVWGEAEVGAEGGVWGDQTVAGINVTAVTEHNLK